MCQTYGTRRTCWSASRCGASAARPWACLSCWCKPLPAWLAHPEVRKMLASLSGVTLERARPLLTSSTDAGAGFTLSACHQRGQPARAVPCNQQPQRAGGGQGSPSSTSCVSCGHSQTYWPRAAGIELGAHQPDGLGSLDIDEDEFASRERGAVHLSIARAAVSPFQRQLTAWRSARAAHRRGGGSRRW